MEYEFHYQTLVFCVAYWRSLFVLLCFYLLATVLFVFLPLTASDYFFWYLQIVLEYILEINFRGKDTHHAYVIRYNCCWPWSYRHVETPYRIISFANIICFQSDLYHAHHALYSYEVELKKGHLEKNKIIYPIF